MTDLQAEKKLVLDYFNEIDSCNIDSLPEVISKYACLLYTSPSPRDQ